jgi:uncharacterized protein YbbC (DUF1343 family)/CubicO group peptidase (beta-lactamase class C family)
VGVALAQRQLPGCVVVVGTDTRVLFRRAYGYRAVDPAREPMTLDTVFDLASLTKPIATAASVMVLSERGTVSLDEPAARTLTELGTSQTATLRDLLLHTSGLPVETPVADFARGRPYALDRIFATAKAPPGARFQYSDLGFILLEEVVRRAASTDLATFAREAVFTPLGMRETMFQPPPELVSRIAPTEYRLGGMIRGEVHDPRAWRLGGVAGHAGLFSTARDLSRFAQAMLRGGANDSGRAMSERTLDAFTAPHDVPGAVRALGWDVRSAYSTNRGDGLSPRAYGHGGYTGTSLWIDPEKRLFVLLLSNRVHPNGKGSMNALAGKVAHLAATVAAPPYPRLEPGACDGTGGAPLTGIDVLRAEGFARLRGAKVGLLTNDGARAKDGRTTLEVLRAASDVSVVALFAAEHGLGARAEGAIAGGTDAATGLPLYSLYGASKSPSPEALASIDTLVVDLPDVGTRFYTYASTLRRAMEAAAPLGVRVVVLDRPNPLDGVTVEGPMLESARIDFANHHPLPVRHGMTLGELAYLFDADRHLGTRLEVVRVEGWRRRDLFEATGLAWTPPSPNLRTSDEALLYPAVGLLEATNLSVGRGTDAPFEQLGAPWIDGAALTDALVHAGLPGVSFEAARFVPSAAPYRGELCEGVRLRLTAKAAFESVHTGLTIARELAQRYAARWKSDGLVRLVGHAGVVDAVLGGRPWTDVLHAMDGDVRAFRDKREKYLLYPLEPCVR